MILSLALNYQTSEILYEQYMPAIQIVYFVFFLTQAEQLPAYLWCWYVADVKIFTRVNGLVEPRWLSPLQLPHGLFPLTRAGQWCLVNELFWWHWLIESAWDWLWSEEVRGCSVQVRNHRWLLLPRLTHRGKDAPGEQAGRGQRPCSRSGAPTS